MKKGLATRVYSVDKKRLQEAIDALRELADSLQKMLDDAKKVKHDPIQGD